MAKIKMTITEAMNNHAVIEKLWLNDREMPVIALIRNLFDGSTLEWAGGIECEVELIDSETIEIKIAALQKRLEQLNALKALHGVAE